MQCPQIGCCVSVFLSMVCPEFLPIEGPRNAFEARDARRKQGMIESELVDEKALMTGAAQVVGKAR